MPVKVYDRPDRASWKDIATRPSPLVADVAQKVTDILQEVKGKGDLALLQFAKRFDRVDLEDLRVSLEEWNTAVTYLDDDLKKSIDQAKANVHLFHSRQVSGKMEVSTMPGVSCWRESRAIEKVGLYIPGGTAPLFSTVLMLAIPASIAGCSDIVLCTPPDKDGSVHPAILYAAHITGVTAVYKVGGAQAIAAMAFGTESIPQVYKIFGPGNHFVTEAKMQLFQSGVAIDMPAGPSEVLVIADHTANPQFVAADLISQAEHGADSQAVLVTTDQKLIDKTQAALSEQLASLPRKAIAEKSLDNSLMIRLENMEDAFAFSNIYAPEHLIISIDDPMRWTDQIVNAGSVFLGHYSPESVGDYASGTNHTLPTNSWARSYSGVSLDSFLKKITFQQLSKEGLSGIGPVVMNMAKAELLEGHSRAVEVRLKQL